MKKIIFVMLIVLCMSGCGNKVEKDDVVKNDAEQEHINLSTEIDMEIEDNNGSSEYNENKEIDKVEEIVEKNDIPENIESDKKHEESEINEPKNEILYEEGIEIGKKAVDFEVELLSGEKVKLSDYLGTPVFLNFWATWCGPCVGEMPDIEKIKAQYGDKIVILAINGGESKNDVKTFIAQKGYTFNIGIDEYGEVLTKYDSMYIPLSIFINEEGVIQDRCVGALSEKQMKEIVDRLINKE